MPVNNIYWPKYVFEQYDQRQLIQLRSMQCSIKSNDNIPRTHRAAFELVATHIQNGYKLNEIEII